jgi:hypothetical protein
MQQVTGRQGSSRRQCRRPCCLPHRVYRPTAAVRGEAGEEKEAREMVGREEKKEKRA